MGKRHRIIKKPRDGAIEVTARQLDRFMDYRGGRLNSRDYKNLPNMILVNSPARDAIWALKQYDDETLLRVMNKASLGRGKRVYVRIEREGHGRRHRSFLRRADGLRCYGAEGRQMRCSGRQPCHRQYVKRRSCFGYRFLLD